MTDTPSSPSSTPRSVRQIGVATVRPMFVPMDMQMLAVFQPTDKQENQKENNRRNDHQ
jgi:hypothetical protein